MNTKLLAGISLAAMAGSFWACGDGPINGKDSSDVIVESMFASPEELQSLKEQAEDDCKTNDPSCAEMYGEYLNRGANPTPSSVTAPTSSASGPIQPQPGESSSSEALNNANKRSSSSHFELPSYAEEASSSSEAKPVTGLGSCAPVTTPVDKNKPTTWKFTPNKTYSPTAFADAMYDWKFGESATPAEYSIKTNTTTEAVTYASAGLMNASVNVTMPDGSSELIACDPPLQVNGDPITDCECKPTAETIDISQNAIATWSVTGCTTPTVSLPLTYEWDADIAGDGANGGYQFTAVGKKAPSVTVHNNDGTAVKVTCGAVKATDGPEYVLEIEKPTYPSSQQVPQTSVDVGNAECLFVKGEWGNSGYTPKLSVECSVSCENQGDKQCYQLSDAVSIALGTDDMVSGQYSASARVLISNALSVGVIEETQVCVKFSGLVKDNVANCKFVTN